MSLGFAQASPTSSAALLSALITIPAAARMVKMQVDAAPVRYTLDGTTPTTALGLKIIHTAELPTIVTVDDGLRAMKVIAESGSPKLNCEFF